MAVGGVVTSWAPVSFSESADCARLSLAAAQPKGCELCEGNVCTMALGRRVAPFSLGSRGKPKIRLDRTNMHIRSHIPIGCSSAGMVPSGVVARHQRRWHVVAVGGVVTSWAPVSFSESADCARLSLAAAQPKGCELCEGNVCTMALGRRVAPFSLGSRGKPKIRLDRTNMHIRSHIPIGCSSAGMVPSGVVARNQWTWRLTPQAGCREFFRGRASRATPQLHDLVF